jgi:hypothetical protein
MGIKRTQKTQLANKIGTKKRTLNVGRAGKKLAQGALFSEQDPKRRSGRFEGKGEITRGGVRGK